MAVTHKLNRLPGKLRHAGGNVPLKLRLGKLSYLGGGLTDFFDRSPQQLRLWEIKGLLNSLRRDVLTDWF